jgi:hypothetical protein
MAEKGPTKKVGPLPVWGWGAVGAGTYLAYYLYKSHANNVAAAQTTAADGTIGGTTSLLDPNLTGAASTSSVVTNPFQTWRSNVLAALQGKGLSSGAALSALNDYLAGQAVPNATSGNALKAVLGDIGLAPGYGYLPVTIAKTAPPVTTTHTPTETYVTTPTTGGGGSRPAAPAPVVTAKPATKPNTPPKVRPKGGAAGPNRQSGPIPYNVNNQATNVKPDINNDQKTMGVVPPPNRLTLARLQAAQATAGGWGPLGMLTQGPGVVLGWAVNTFNGVPTGIKITDPRVQNIDLYKNQTPPARGK